jgi:hypothetical protein
MTAQHRTARVHVVEGHWDQVRWCNRGENLPVAGTVITPCVGVCAVGHVPSQPRKLRTLADNEAMRDKGLALSTPYLLS